METIKKIIEKIEEIKKEEMNLFNFYLHQKEENGFTQEFLDRQVCKFAHSSTILDDLKEFIEKEIMKNE